ncbi:MAG TPA: hypothetical protein VIH38_14030, partial [Steroidobacteraceae bacterium]
MVEVADRAGLREKPLLDRRQRSRGGIGRRRRGLRAPGDLGERRDRLMLKNLSRGDCDSVGAGARHQLNRLDRVSACLEEVIIDADAVDAEEFC